MPKKRPQTIRGSRKFAGTDPLTANDLKRLRVTTFDGAAKVFLENWNQEPTLLVGLTLTQDNSQIENATALLQGTIWPEGKDFDASIFWNLERDDLILSFEKIDLSKFNFEAVITSKFLDHDQLDYAIKVKSDNTALSPAELKSMGYPGFCIRVFCCPTSTASAKVAMLLFPLHKELLVKEYSLALYYNFPGISMERFEVELGIQRDELLNNNYGCPLLPVIKTTEPIRSNTVVPDRQEFVYAIGTLLRQTRAPDGKSSHVTLLKSWAQLKKHGESKLKQTAWEYEWIKPVDPAAVTGKHL